MKRQPHALTAERIAVAVVAAAECFGDDPAAALAAVGGTTARRCVTAAADGLQAATGQPVVAVCRVLQIFPTTLFHARTRRSDAFRKASKAARRAVQSTLPEADPGPPPVSAPVPAKPAAPTGERKPRRPRPASTRPAAPARPDRMARITPLTGRKLRYVRRFMAAGWDVDEVADLFSVDPAAVADACRRAAA